MELQALISALSDPGAYPHPVDEVAVRQTHISAVFLAGAYAYKIKKPFDLGFLDFGTLDRRRHFCEVEDRLNRRLAPSVYLGVVPIARDGDRLRVEGPGEVVEWAVKMARLPEEATLRARLRRGELDAATLEALARRVAAFHAAAEGGPAVAAHARFEAVARNARENFEQSERHVGRAVSRAVFERLRERTEAALERLRPLIESRAGRGVPRDTHGDLRLEHVYLFPDKPPPDDLAVVDCIEFAERFRHADPVSDAAFLVMELARHGRRDLAQAFAEAYFRASGDDEGRALLPFYVAYRAAVRAKVQGIKQAGREVSEDDRARALAEARAHWPVALGALEEPGRRPALVLVGGLPGSGKSTLALGLAERAGFEVIRSDVVRKELAGAGEAPAPAAIGEGIYTPEWNERTYAECARRASARLFEGARVVVDASFAREADRLAFLGLATASGVPAALLACRANPAVVRARLDARRGDASDADWSIHAGLAGRWEAFGPDARRAAVEVDTGADRSEALGRALDALREAGLAG